MARMSGKSTKSPKSLSKKVAAVKNPIHRQIPGLNPFKTTPGKAIQKKGGRVTSKEVTANQIGIHSLEWASKIAPNSSRLFSLTAEIRLGIWKQVINDLGYDFLCPSKFRNKFADLMTIKLGKTLIGLYTLCRQAYVDIHGSALLYRLKKFDFTSSYQMLNYLSTINPHHRNAIVSITLACGSSHNYTINTKELTWSMLQSMSSLRNLQLDVPHYGTLAHHGFVQLIDNLKENKGLMRIRGLKEFEMCPSYNARLDAGETARLKEVNDEIRELVLQGKAA